MVSVIITTRNQEELVEQCVSSIINQRYNKPFEIIIIDDASNDRTVEIIRNKFVDKTKIITKREPAGWLNSLVKGCELAKGDLLVLFDPHCTAKQNWLETIVSIFEDEHGLLVLTGPANHGSKFMQKVSAITFHAPFVSNERKNIDYIFDDNFAIKKDVLQKLFNELPVDKNVNDGVGSTLLSSLIKKQKIPVLYEPRIGAFHISPDFRGYLKEWGGFSAEATIRVRQLDYSIRGANWLKYPLLASGIFAFVRFIQDIGNIKRYHKEVNLSFWEIPFLLLVSALGKLYYFMGLLKTFKIADVK